LPGVDVAAIPLGRGLPARLGATHPHATRARSARAYSVLLRVEIAAFHPPPPRWPAIGVDSSLWL